MKRVVILLGAPGSGKSTLGRGLGDRINLPIISTGNLLRAVAELKTPLADRVARSIESGCLVPDDVILQLLRNRLSMPDCAAGFILDGYPRTVRQTQALEKLLASLRVSAPLIVSLEISESSVLQRLRTRFQCEACRRIYNRSSADEQFEHCTHDGRPLVRRSDDSEPIVLERLRLYRQLMSPVLAFYSGRGLHRLDANQNADVLAEIAEASFRRWYAPRVGGLGRVAMVDR